MNVFQTRFIFRPLRDLVEVRVTNSTYIMSLRDIRRSVYSFPRRLVYLLLPDNEQQIKCAVGVVNHDIVLMLYIGYQTAVIGLQLVSIPAI